MAKNKYDKEKEERDRAKKAQQNLLNAYKAKVGKSDSSSSANKIAKVDTSKVGTYSVPKVNRDKKGNASLTQKPSVSASKNNSLAKTTTTTPKIVAPLTNKAREDLLTAPYKQQYEKARANNNILGMRVANTQANAVRAANNIPKYDSGIGDSQFAKSRNLALPTQAEINKSVALANIAKATGGAKNNSSLKAGDFLRNTNNPQTAINQGMAQNIKTNAGVRAYQGWRQGLNPIYNMENQFAERYGEDALKALQSSKAYAAGDVAGEMTRFALAYGLVGGGIGAGLAKTSKFANMGKLGQTVTKSLATDLAVDSVMQPLQVMGKEGLRGQEAAKEIAKNTAIDMTLGAGLEGIGHLAKVANNKIRIKKESNNLMEQVNEMFEGKISERKPLTVGQTPEILRNHGAENRQMTLNQGTVRKIAYPSGYMGVKRGHNLGFEAIKRLPQELNDPVAILKSKTQPNSQVIFTNLVDENNYPVMAALHLNKEGNLGISNDIASMYGRGKYKNFIEEARKDGDILYEKKRKGLDSLPASGLQLSGVEAKSDPIFNIAKKNETVKNPTLEEVTNTIKEKLIANGNQMRKDKVAELTAQHQEVKRLKQVTEDIKKSQKLTEREEEMVNWLLHGEVSLENLPPDVRGNAVRDVYLAEKAKKDAEKQLQRYNIERKANLQKQMNSLMTESDSFKDKGGFSYSRETAERNIIDIAGKKNGERIIKQVFEPVHKNEAASNTMKNQLRDKIKSLNISQKPKYSLDGVSTVGVVDLGKVSESTLVQLLGEQKISLDDVRRIGADPNKIQNAVNEMRIIYNDLLEKGNEVLVLNGYEPIPFRKDYFPHFVDNKPDSTLGKIANKLGFNIQTDELPTDIAGLTHTFRPGKKWFGNALQRKGDDTVYDAIQGFDMYLEGISDVIYHTDDIQRLRALESNIRHKYSDKGIQEEVERILSNPTTNELEKQASLNELYKDNPHTKLNNFVQWVREYTDNLAGKKSLQDRIVEKEIGRTSYNVCKSLEGRVAANMVAVNPASWLTNLIPLFQGTEVSTVSSLKALEKTLKSYVNNDGFRKTSTFLTNRSGSEALYKTGVEKLSGTLSSPMSWIDDFTTEVLTRAKYYDGISKGRTHEEAIAAADRFTAQVVGDRSKGALPTIFNQKNPGTKLLTMFQVEVNNQLSYLLKDLPKNTAEIGKFNFAMALAKYSVGAYIYNDVYEKLTGRRPALDGLGMLNEFVETSTGYGVPNMVDLMSGEDRNFHKGLKNKEHDFVGGIANLGTNIAENTPFIGGLIGGGRIPISSALPNIANTSSALVGLTTGEMNQTKALNTLGKEMAKPAAYLIPPVGGGQLKKMAEGALTLKRGGSYAINSDGEKELQFAVDPKPTTIAQSLLFGKYSSEGGQSYIGSNFDRLNAKQTVMYELLRKSGFTNTQAEEAIRGIGDIKKDTEKRQAILDLNTDAKTKQAIGNILDGEEKYDYSSQENYDFSRLDDAQQEKYMENFSDIQKAYYTQAIKTLSDNSKEVSSAAGKALLLMETNEYGTDIAKGLYSDRQFKKAQELKDLDISAVQYEKIRKELDTNNNGSLTKAEIRQGIDARTDLEPWQKAYMKKIMIKYN